MEHQFCVELASVYGIEEAIIIHNLYFWIKKNVANEINLHDGRYWTYNSSKAFTSLFPYMTESKIYRVLKSLEEKGVILKGNYNETKYDRTTWYSFSDKSLKELEDLKYDVKGFSEGCLQNEGMHFTKTQNGFYESERPIPYSNTDSKQNNKEDKKEWRENFEDYLEIVQKAKDKILLDAEFRQYIEKYYPNSDYNATLNKLVDGFWGKTDGWEHNKSKRKGKTINMVSTLKRNMDKRERIVYKQKDNRKKYSSLENKSDKVELDMPILNQDGDLPDGTFYKGGKRWYISEKDGRPYSIPLKAPNRPDKRSEWSVTKQTWYVPLESWEASDELW